MNEKKFEKYLPVGTVVMLKEGKKRIMITGFAGMDGENATKIYDYIACLYPEGVISSNKNILFDHNQIKTIYHLGLSDDEDKDFKSKLVEVVKTMEKNNDNNVVNNIENNIENNQ